MFNCASNSTVSGAKRIFSFYLILFGYNLQLIAQYVIYFAYYLLHFILGIVKKTYAHIYALWAFPMYLFHNVLFDFSNTA